MNKTLISLLPLCWVLAGCSETPRSATAIPSSAPVAPPSASVIPNCPPRDTDRACPSLPNGLPDPSKRNKIKIVVSAVDVKAKPSVVCTSSGDTIVVTVVGIPDHAKVATVPKDGADGWILSSRTGEGTMSILVPDEEDVPEGDYGYFAFSSTGKCVDPVIRVDN